MLSREWMRSLCVFGLLLSAASTFSAERFSWRKYSRKPDSWLASDEGRRVTDNVLAHQGANGCWPKNIDTATAKPRKDAAERLGTYDNGATIGEIRFLATALAATGAERCRKACLRGIDATAAPPRPR